MVRALFFSLEATSRANGGAAIEDEKKIQKKLPMDGFHFSYLPRSWPAADNSDGRTKYAEIALSTDEIRELSQDYKHQQSVPLCYRVYMLSCLDYFTRLFFVSDAFR